jgi:hypothetical protein
MQHDADRPVDTDGEDHAVDECRYACMSRPYVIQKAAKPPSDHVVLQADAQGRLQYVRDDGAGGEEVVSLRDVVLAHCRAKKRQREERFRHRSAVYQDSSCISCCFAFGFK